MNNLEQNAACRCKDLSSEQLEITLSYLMSRFAERPNTKLAHAVLHHLEILIEHADPGLSSAKRKHYVQLFNLWWVKVYKSDRSEQVIRAMQSAHDSGVRH